MIPGHAMGGMHLFEIIVESNDPVEPEKSVLLRFNIIEDDIIIEEE